MNISEQKSENEGFNILNHDFSLNSCVYSFCWPTADRPKKSPPFSICHSWLWFVKLQQLSLVQKEPKNVQSRKKTTYPRCGAGTRAQVRGFFTDVFLQDEKPMTDFIPYWICHSDGYLFLSSSVSCFYRNGPQSQDQYGNNFWQNDVTMNAYSWFKFSTSTAESWSHCLLHCPTLLAYMSHCSHHSNEHAVCLHWLEWSFI